MKATNETVTKYWLAFYMNRDRNLCGLCANTGVIDTTGATSHAGVAAGGKHYCICPNGQALRRQYGPEGDR